STGTAPKTTATASTTTSGTATTTHKQQPYSSDPFAPNYRKIFPWSEQEKAEFIATWPLPLPPNFWVVHESVEFGEYMRPTKQLQVLLRRRGLEDKFSRIMTGRDDEVEGELGTTQTETQPLDNEKEKIYEKARKLLMEADEGGELLERAEEIWRNAKVRLQSLEGKIGVERLLEVGDVVGYNWIRM
ncbi:hypothetical protein K458DRAFT_246320, partial [Lentithecium fluviatile CBS 122367]